MWIPITSIYVMWRLIFPIFKLLPISVESLQGRVVFMRDSITSCFRTRLLFEATSPNSWNSEKERELLDKNMRMGIYFYVLNASREGGIEKMLTHNIANSRYSTIHSIPLSYYWSSFVHHRGCLPISIS